MKKTLSFLGNMIFVAVILYLCYFIIEAVQDKSPSVFGYRMLRVMTDSMMPAFEKGDCIIIQETDAKELAVGDIITFISSDPILDGGLNTHRIIDIAEDYITGTAVYYTKGDNNSWEDEYVVTYEDIVGKYIKTMPFGRKVSAFLGKLSNRSYYFAVVIVPILFCFVSCVIQLVRDIRKK